MAGNQTIGALWARDSLFTRRKTAELGSGDDAMGREEFLKRGFGRKFIKRQLTHYLKR